MFHNSVHVSLYKKPKSRRQFQKRDNFAGTSMVQTVTSIYTIETDTGWSTASCACPCTYM